jgi:hypothetical protein
MSYVLDALDEIEHDEDIPEHLRAKGFDTVVYHTTRTNKPFTQFNPPPEHRGVTFFAPTAKGSQAGASGSAAELSHLSARPDKPTPPRTAKLYVRSQDIHGLHLTPHEKDWWHKAPDKVVGDDEFTKQVVKTKPRDVDWDMAYDYKRLHGDTFEYTKKKEIPHISLAHAMKTHRDVYGQMLPGYNDSDEADKRSADRTVNRDKMSGFVVSDEGDVSIAHAHPHHPDKVHLAKWLD